MRIFTILPAVILAILLPATTRSQINRNWASTLASPSTMVSCVKTDASGNVYVAGIVTNTFSYILIKYNASGVQQWVAAGSAGTAFYDLGYPGIAGIGIDQSGNVYITSNWLGGMGTTAYNSSGQQLWYTVPTYNNCYCVAYAATVDASGNVYITGKAEADGGSAGTATCLTVKLNSAGSQQWAVAYSSTLQESLGLYIALDASGNVYVAGNVTNPHLYISGGSRGGIITFKRDTTLDIVAIKYDPSGNTLWTNTYNGGYQTNDSPDGLALDASANVYLIGYSKATSQVNEIIAWSTGGTQLWLNQDLPAVTSNSSIAVDPSGNILTLGSTGSSFNVTKYTSAGTLSWTYYGSAISSGNSYMALDNEGNCYVTGTAAGNYTTVQVSASGTQGWEASYSGPVNGLNKAAGIAVFNLPSSRPGVVVSYPEIDVAGTADNGTEIATVQYQYKAEILAASKTDSLAGQATIAPFASQLSNFPNPFRSATTITYTLSSDSHVILQVYNGTGRPVTTLVDEDETAGPHTLSFNASRLAPGLYPYRITAVSPQGSFTQTKQMLIQ
ncbi:MAG TPA: T9SS type A sorting domain-containing protein [Puia sp.]|nr:T9SS type A sorting domain-containing protein [Puia sp.]